MEDCFYCTKDHRLWDLMEPLLEMAYANVYLLRDQKHPGRCVVAAKRHVTEIHRFDKDERDGFFADIALVACAIGVVFQPDKINYAVYGDLVPHFHVHVVPKHISGLRWGEPFLDDDLKEIATDEALKEIKERLLVKILQV